MKIGGNSGGGDFAQPDEGQQVAVLAKVYDVGVQAVEWQGETKMKATVALVWELQSTQEDGSPFTLVDTLTASTSKKAKLFGVIGALLRKPIEEWSEIDTDQLEGRCAMLMIGHGRKGSAFISRVDALQVDTKLDIQGAYGADDEIHGLVAWHMGRAEADTVPAGQGDMPTKNKPKAEEAGGKHSSSTPEEAAGAPTEGDFDDIPF